MRPWGRSLNTCYLSLQVSGELRGIVEEQASPGSFGFFCRSLITPDLAACFSGRMLLCLMLLLAMVLLVL